MCRANWVNVGVAGRVGAAVLGATVAVGATVEVGVAGLAEDEVELGAGLPFVLVQPASPPASAAVPANRSTSRRASS